MYLLIVLSDYDEVKFQTFEDNDLADKLQNAKSNDEACEILWENKNGFTGLNAFYQAFDIGKWPLNGLSFDKVFCIAAT